MSNAILNLQEHIKINQYNTLESLQSDVKALQSDVKILDYKIEVLDTKIDNVRIEVKELNEKIDKRIGEVRTELSNEIKEVRTELSNRIDRLEIKVDGNHKGLTRLLVTILIAIFGVLATALLPAIISLFQNPPPY